MLQKGRPPGCCSLRAAGQIEAGSFTFVNFPVDTGQFLGTTSPTQGMPIITENCVPFKYANRDIHDVCQSVDKFVQNTVIPAPDQVDVRLRRESRRNI